MRASIVKDERFQRFFTNDYWLGARCNSGDDGFITRWMHTEGWDCEIQNADGAMIEISVSRDASMLKQMLRWTRTSIQNRLRLMFWEPGFGKLYQWVMDQLWVERNRD